MTRHLWIDGRVEPVDGPHLSAFDRGFQLGDGVFETLRARAGNLTEIDEHLARLRRSAEGLGIDLPSDAEERIEAGVRALLAADRMHGPDGDASVRITVSRGAFFERGLLPPAEEVDPTIVIQAWPVTPPPSGHLEHGLRLVTSAVRRDPANPLMPLKTTSRADYVYARIEARRADADDALFLTIDGAVSESTSANIFIVRRQPDGTPQLATPSLECAILPGTTRSWLLAWGDRVGLSPVEVRLTPADLADADEAFISASVAGVLPVTSFDGRPLGSGRPGPWTLQARRDREAFIAGEIAR